MSNNLKVLREQRNELVREVRNLVDKNTGEAWDSAKHQPIYDAKMSEIERVEAEIERTQKVFDMDAEREFKNAGVREIELSQSNKSSTARNLYNKFLRGGDKHFTADDWDSVRNTMSTTTDSEGGYAVPGESVEGFIDSLKAFGGMRSVATVIRTANGSPMSWATSDGTSEEGEIIVENDTATDSDPTFGTKSLPVYKYSSKVITVPIELLQDSSVDIESFINQRFQTRLGRITNKHYTTGTGSSQPNGIVTAASLGKAGASGQTTTVTYADLIDLEHSVDPAYRDSASCVFMFNDSTLKSIRKIVDSNSRPIFLPSYDAGGSAGAPATINNRRYVINQQVAVMAANAKSILFGDFSKYVIRDVMDISVYRFADSAYMKKGQVGFLAWMRTGGNFVDIGGAVKYYQNAAS